MKIKFLFLLVFLTKVAFPSDTLSLMTWNIQNLGKSKSNEEVAFMASVIKGFDLVAVQEVVAGEGGAQAVSRLAENLNRTGARWDYCISDKTTGTKGSVERYAFLWKTSRVRKYGTAKLDDHFMLQIDREPYMATFIFKTDTITLVNLHAIPKSKQPETEIKYLKYFPGSYPDKQLVFLGDFNCPQSHSVFTPLMSAGYNPIVREQKTTLKRGCRSKDCLASEYDNIFYPFSKMRSVKASVVHFQLLTGPSLQPEAISDHLPLVAWFVFESYQRK
jgi:deoxyribonuclease-1-like protein